MRAYQEVVRKIMWEGVRKENRTGVDTISTFGVHYTHDMSRGFPLLTTKAMSWKNVACEMAWFLAGSWSVRDLHRHGVHFWDDWADGAGRVPVSYGAMWREFPDAQFPGAPADGGFAVKTDQLAWLVGELKRNPLSRRLVCSAWSPSLCHSARLPPCPVMFVANVQEGPGGRTLSLHVTQRSADVALGVPYDLASYALLLELLSRFSGLRAGTLSHLLVDAHAYTAKPDGSMSEHDHLPGLREQLLREPRRLPRLAVGAELQTLGDAEKLLALPTERILAQLALEDYQPYPAIRFKVAV